MNKEGLIKFTRFSFELFYEYANWLGHQNHKQKIQHLVRLKQENLDMHEELAKVAPMLRVSGVPIVPSGS